MSARPQDVQQAPKRRRVHWRHSLRTQIAAWSGAVNVLLLLLMALSVAWAAQRMIMADARSNTQANAEAAAGRLSNAMRAVMITSKGVSDLIANSELDPQELTATMRAMVEATPGCAGGLIVLEAMEPQQPSFARYVSADGQDRDFVADDYDYRAQGWFSRTMTAPRGWWSEPYYSETSGGRWMLTYNMPLRPQGRGATTRGMISLDLPLTYLTSNFESLAHLPGWRISLVAPAGTLATNPFVKVQDNLTLEQYAQRAGRTDLKPIAEAVRLGQSLHLTHTDVVNGQKLFTVVTPVGDSGWMLIVGQAYSLIIERVHRALSILLLSGLVLAALSMYGVRKLASKISRPVESLTASATYLAEGHYDSPVPHTTRKDEVGLMARSLEHARISIQQQLIEIEDMGAARQKLESELSIARDIQLSMLPHGRTLQLDDVRLEAYAQLEPAKQVGGDFYSFVESPDGQLWFAIGDVSDKGVPAALFMARVVTVLEVAAHTYQTPEQVLAETSRKLVEGNDTCMFATVLCGKLDLRSGRIMLASAGHEAPVLLQANGDSEFLPLQAGPPLGFEISDTFEIWHGLLPDGATLFAYTDGVTEAFDPHNQAFGSERLQAALDIHDNAQDQCAQLVAKVHAFAHPAPQSDDITVLALRLRRDAQTPPQTKEASPC